MDKNKNTIHNPHDKAFFKSLENLEVARDALQAYLPPELLAQVDLTRLKLYKTKLISPEYKEFDADVIFEAPLIDHTGLFLFHFEQMSTVTINLPLRVWQYLLLTLMEYHENHPKEPLPIIYTIIIYTGESPYTASTDFFDLFGTRKELAKHYLLNPIKFCGRVPHE